MKRVDVAYAFICKEEEGLVLLVNNVGGRWSLPGGEVEKGETLKQAVVREAKEETGLTIEAGNIVAVNEVFFHEKGHHALFFTFEATITGGEIAIQYEDEISEIKWVDFEKANKLLPFHPGGMESLVKSNASYMIDG
ncbi:NUDIX hydrolase [Virgibacillus kekensis]|uniref:NUDIX hydrolase n=1 Tax=Virgibacillus kekensis TaxID=202261 RepID=A0ABV9DMI0_9BACI